MAVKKTIAEATAVDLGRLLDAGNRSVVTLQAGETQLVAHRAVLEARSLVFKSLLGQDKSSNWHEVTNVEGPVLRELVSYCYTLRTPQLPGMAPDLLAAARVYQLPALKAACEQQVLAQLTVENAAEFGVLALRHGCPELEWAAVALVKADPEEVLSTQSCEDTERRYPHHVVQLYRRVVLELPVANSGARKQQLVPKLTVENAAELAVLALRSGDFDRVRAAIELIKAHPREALETRSFEVTYRIYPHDLLTLLRLVILERPGATRSPDSAGDGPTNNAQQLNNRSRRVPAAAATTTTTNAVNAAPPVAGACSRFQCLSGDEKARRLIQAAQQGAAKALRALLAAGADAGARDGAGLTALHWAAFEGHAEAARRLLEAGAEPGAASRGRDTPLHLAVLGGHQEVARLLLEAGAAPDAGNSRRRTPLHLAAWCGREEAAAALLAAGADAAARDDDGNTPADYASLFCRRQLVEMLR